MKNLLLFLNMLFGIIGFLAIPMALMSVMMFDAPGSENNNYVWMAFWSMVALPFTCLISVACSSYIARHSQNYKKALLIALLPCIVIAVIILSFVLIQIYCGGSFSCGK